MEKIIPISDLQTKTKEVVEGVKKTGDPVIITQRSRPVVVIVNYERYGKMLQTLEILSRAKIPSPKLSKRQRR